MDNLILNPSSYTPGVNFDFKSGLLELSGTSTPEDSYNFFQPLMNWLELYKKSPARHTTLVFKMEYFNTSSTAFILRIIKAVGLLKEEGKEISIQWFYQEEDDDLVEAGRDFGILAETNIELVQIA
jgi:hypothetical protein